MPVSPGQFSAVFTDAGEVTGRPPDVHPSEFVCTEFTGAMVTPRRHEISALSRPAPDFTLDEADEAGGEWMGVFTSHTSPRTFVVRADPLGYQAVFYRIDPRTDGRTDVYIASSAPTLTDTLTQHRRAVDLDWLHLLPNLMSQHAWTHTAHSPRTFGRDVWLLQPGDQLVISPNGVGIQPHSPFSRKGDYDELLDRGIRRAAGQILQAARIGAGHHNIYLSGGKDSRMVLALMAAAGITDRFTVRSHNPLTWPNPAGRPTLEKDLVIADVLRRRFGMSWAPSRESVVVPTSFHDGLDGWMSFRSNRDFRLSMSMGIGVPTHSAVELRGGAGETMRSFVSMRRLWGYSRYGDTPESYVKDAELFLSEVYHPARLPKHVREQLPGHAATMLEAAGGRTITETLHRGYSLYRNRVHFGHARHSLRSNTLPLMPLSQPEFLSAAALLTPDDRAQGALVFDLIERTAPELNDLPFDGGPWNCEMRARRTTGSPADWEVPGRLDAVEGFFGPGDRSPNIESKGRPVDTRYQREFLELMADLGSLPGAGEHLPAHLRQDIVAMAGDGRLSATGLVAKLRSARDMITGSSPQNTRHYAVGTATTAGCGPFDELAAHRLADPERMRVRTGTFDVSPTIEFTPARELAVDLGLEAVGHADDLEFAFYLMREGRKERVKWYGDTPSARFELDEAGGRYKVKMFIRFREQPELKFIQVSEPIEVPPVPTLAASSTAQAQTPEDKGGRSCRAPQAHTLYHRARRRLRRLVPGRLKL